MLSHKSSSSFSIKFLTNSAYQIFQFLFREHHFPTPIPPHAIRHSRRSSPQPASPDDQFTRLGEKVIPSH